MRSAASVSRHWVRNSIGGWPTTSAKRRASVARETRAWLASAPTVHVSAGLSCNSRIVLSPVPAGRGVFRPGEVGAHGVDQQQVEQPRTRLCPACAKPTTAPSSPPSSRSIARDHQPLVLDILPHLKAGDSSYSRPVKEAS